MRLVLTVTLLAASLASQSGNFVSPDGLATREGNSYHWAPFSYPAGRFQQVDPSARRFGPATLKSIAFRRDAVQAGGASRTIEMDVYLGNGNATTYSNSFGSNFSSPPVAVFAKKQVSLPDWTTPPVTPPATFDFVLTLDQAWPYAGTNDLVWDLSVYSSSKPAYDLWPVDRAFTTYTYGVTTVNGTGRTTQHGLFRLNGDARATQTTIQLGFTMTGAPPSALASLAIGTTDVNTPLPGLCANLRPIVLVTVPLGTCSASGVLPPAALKSKFDPTLFGIVLITQGLALDATQTGFPVAVTNGMSILTPLSLGGVLVEASYTYDTTNPLATIGSGPHTGALVVRFGT